MFKKIVAYSILSYVLFGCATGKMEQIGKDYDMDKHPQSVVFGKIDVKENIIGFSTKNSFPLISPQREPSYVNFSRDEYFFIALEPGEYTIRHLSCGYGLSGAMGFITHNVPVNLSFSVGSNEVIYIGKILVEYQANGDGPVLGHQINISDEYDQAVIEFRKQYPNIKKDIKKNLVR